MLQSKVPNTYKDLIALAVKAVAGAQSHGPAIGIVLNTSAAITADLHSLIGDPATPLAPGKQTLYNTRKQAVRTARIAARVAIATGREFCRIGIALLKPVLGTTYNGQWEEAGFLTPSLAMPDHPVAMLIEFRQYLEANPTRERADSGFTAALAHTRMTAVQSAELGVSTAESETLAAQRVRDLAKRTLQKRLSGLRGELVQLLSREDGAWREFGFRRPADGRIPDVVEGVVLSAGLPGSVIVAWNAASLADDYRVLWRAATDAPEAATEVGLFSDLQTLIPGLPSGTSIIVGVTSRNASGETDPTEATITVP